ncbi:hypothetical protein [Pseudomonas putida]|uniref:hypothetical protein n=1 Tax=Pseudomonas putida TaxID=303 RepID=UPI002B24A56E|nr:hypothetical protein [Pseudomonas putida]
MKNNGVKYEAPSSDLIRERAIFEDCLTRTPDATKKYYLLLECTNNEIAYYSKGVINEDGEEERVLRLVRGIEAAAHYRARGVKVLVLENAEELKRWVVDWGNYIALVEMSVWKKFEE